MTTVEQRLARELGVREAQVVAAVGLLDDGATVPFIARYRKEATGELDDQQLRQLEERLHYLRELDERRGTILQTIREQGLTDVLRAAIEAADSKTRLEDLFLPYKPKRRTKARMAREAGLEPLALSLFEHPEQDPEQLAARFLAPEHGIDAAAALAGARQILMERFAEDAELVGELRDHVRDRALLCAKPVDGREQADAKFADYFDYREALPRIPSHRMLALLRGRNEGFLNLGLEFPDLDPERPHPCEARIARHCGIRDRGRPADLWLLETARRTWRVKLSGRIELELLQQLRQRAEDEAIQVFARNLKDLLLAAPAGPRPTIGLDPGLRTGVKVAVVDVTGKLVDTDTIYPHAPRKHWDAAIATLARLAGEHRIELISIGNGTASRETDRLVAELIQRHPELALQKLLISEAGASVYSASSLASEELPDIDVSLRGAASIARRLQDPLAELVKIDPKAIGVGQYQHDINQARLSRALDAVVEDCVNAVGVDVNTASVALLSRVAGLSAGMARQIVAHRDQHSTFVDIGVHQDGLVHVSAMADRFVRDPHDIVKAGDVVRVKVLSVEPERRRIGLTLRLNDEPDRHSPKPTLSKPRQPERSADPRPKSGTLADAFQRARSRR